MSEPAVPSLLATLLERLEERESLDLEFKSARGGLPQDVWRTVSAFANTRGGWIILGVSEREGQYVVEGVPHPGDQLQQFTNHVRNPQRISYPVCGATDTMIEAIGDLQLVVIRVPAAPRRVRPVYVGGNPYGGTFVRRHAGDYACTKQEVDRMMREASDTGADTTVLRNLGWDDLDRNAFDRYRQRFKVARPSSAWNGYDDNAFLEAIGGYRRDNETGLEGITVAGLLMFGTDLAILRWRTRHLIDYQQLATADDPDLRYEDRVVWESNLLGAFETIYARLTAALPVPFRLDGPQRVDESRLHVVLREALVNLLVHADYAETASSLIQRSSEGYFFRNPGSSRVQEADLLAGGRSDPRNPSLVRMFRLIGLAEEAGMGVSEIARVWRALGFRLPRIDAGTERYEFSLRLRYAHLLSEDDRNWLLSLGGPWSEAEQLALVIARHEGEIDNPTLRRVTGEHPADITKVLGGLRNRGLLEMLGGGRGARYQLGMIAQSQLRPMVAGVTEGLGAGAAGIDGSTGDIPVSAGDKPVSTGDKPLCTGDKPVNTGDSAKTIGNTATGPVSEDTPEARVRAAWPSLQSLSEPARQRGRLAPAQRDELVVRLCSVVPLSLQDLTVLLGRGPDHLRHVLHQLVDDNRLAHLYPDRPRHPHQRYIALSASGVEPVNATAPQREELPR